MPPISSLGVIGAGAIAHELIPALAAELSQPLRRLLLLTRPASEAAARALLAKHAERLADTVDVTTDAAAFVAARLNLVAECAGHAAVRAYAADLLRAGSDVIIVSTGALVDDDLRLHVRDAAKVGGTRLTLTCGAIGAIDLVAAARIAGLERLTYTARKPPAAWRGTPAEAAIDLSALTSAVTFFTGDARTAARDYPNNANVAATVALAGGSLDQTVVQLIADPDAPGNVHEISIRSRIADADIRIVNKVSPSNPKTSLATGYALARDILNRIGPLSI